MESCIYEGSVRHRRFSPATHAFAYRLFMMYLDLDEVPTLFAGRWLWSNEGRGLARFRRKDHLGDPDRPLAEAARDLVRARLGPRPLGPIRLLTHFEYFRHRFNPVSFYYCYAPDGRALSAIIAEINNTPWGEQHCYVLDAARPARPPAAARRFRLRKEFHVSPFIGMDVDYDWFFKPPGPRLLVHMENRSGRDRFFLATLALRRVEIDTAALARVLARYPLMTVQVVAAIYYQALRLRLKRCPHVPHPRFATAESNGTPPC